MQQPARPAGNAKPVVRAKPKAKKKQKRPARNVPAEGAVAGATAALPPAAEKALPSDLAAPAAIDTPSNDDGGASMSILMTSLIALALALAALASIPTRQLALLPVTRWVVRRRLDLVIGGMGALAALLGVLFISAVFGP